MALVFPCRYWSQGWWCFRSLSQVRYRNGYGPSHHGLLRGQSLVGLQWNQHLRLWKFDGVSGKRQWRQESGVWT